MKRTIIYIFFIILLSGCEKEYNSLSDIQQEVLFQVDYVNAAWGYQHFGSFIDKTGQVRTYDLPSSWNFPDEDGYISLTDMNENIDQLVDSDCTIEDDVLLKYFNKLVRAEEGKVTEPTTRGADMGATIYSGFVFDFQRNSYKQVLLRQVGDMYIENTSREAEQIYNWLLELCKN